MACQIAQWLISATTPSTLQHALVGIGCLLAYDQLVRWRRARKCAANQAGAPKIELREEADPDPTRRAA